AVGGACGATTVVDTVLPDCSLSGYRSRLAAFSLVPVDWAKAGADNTIAKQTASSTRFIPIPSAAVPGSGRPGPSRLFDIRDEREDHSTARDAGNGGRSVVSGTASVRSASLRCSSMQPVLPLFRLLRAAATTGPNGSPESGGRKYRRPHPRR